MTLLQQALAEHQQGNLPEAARLYMEVLAAEPGNAKAQHMLGAVRLQEGRLDEAIRLIEAALAKQPKSVDALSDGGYALQLSGRIAEAVTYYDRALALRPADAETLLHRAGSLFLLHRHEEALADLERATRVKPEFAEAWRQRGAALLFLRRDDEAIVAFEEALKAKPDFADALIDLGNAYSRGGRYEEAVACYDGAISIDPATPAAYNNRGNALVALGRYIEALVAYEAAITRNPEGAIFHYNRGSARFHLQMREPAMADFDRALAIRPDYAEAHLVRGHILIGLRRHDEAVTSYEAALTHNPALPGVSGYVAHTRNQLCDWSGYQTAIRQIIDGIGRDEASSAPFVFLLLADEPEAQLACAQAWIRSHYAIKPFETRSVATRRGKLRIAYISANFHEHAVACLVAELFERHDPSRYELTGISFGPEGTGAMRGRLRTALNRFEDVRLNSDEEIARMLRDWEIDIAVDLMGYTLDARPGILAYRSAPLQVNYLGYPGTMGAPFIDYIIADRFLVPDGNEAFYSERVVRLPDCYQPNDTKRRIAERTPTRAELGLPERGFVFCSFNNSFKINPPMFDVWMRLLREVERSVLWLLETSGVVKGNLRREAEARGVSGERLIFAPRMDLAEHLARHRAADLFLDTLPYNAHTTASDALWAGLPVLTCAGQSFAARVAGSLLHAVGLPELVTTSLAEYEALALALARDRDRLATLRARLAAHLPTAPLFDIERYRRHLETAYETMWERHLRGEAPRAFDVRPLPLLG